MINTYTRLLFCWDGAKVRGDKEQSDTDGDKDVCIVGNKIRKTKKYTNRFWFGDSNFTFPNVVPYLKFTYHSHRKVIQYFYNGFFVEVLKYLKINLVF